MIADRPQTIVWAFTLSSRTSIWRFMAIWPSVESLFSITPLTCLPDTEYKGQPKRRNRTGKTSRAASERGETDLSLKESVL